MGHGITKLLVQLAFVWSLLESAATPAVGSREVHVAYAYAVGVGVHTVDSAVRTKIAPLLTDIRTVELID
jgi:hypothetical protein